MKHTHILILAFLLTCSLLSGCVHAAAEEEVPTSSATVITPTEAPETMVTFEEVPEETRPFTAPDLPAETVPPRIDDSDYQLPPGETPTLEHEVS